MTRFVGKGFLAGLTAGVLIATLGLPGVATAGPQARTVSACTLRPLPLPGDLNGDARAVDPTGRFIVGTGYRVDGEDRQPLLLLWATRPGVWNQPRLTVVEFQTEPQVYSINRYGVAIGTAYVGDVYRPWRYVQGRLEWLSVPPVVANVSVHSINSRGDIVGTGAVEETETALPLLWPADRPGTVEVIDAPSNSGAAEIFDDGTIVGGTPVFAWVRHLDGTTDRLTVPGARWARVQAARGNWAVGGFGTGSEDEESTLVRWDLRTGVATAVHPALGSPNDVNSQGAVLGTRAVDHGDRLVTLPGAIPDVQITSAWQIADDGLVVGSVNGSRLLPVRWTDC
ncbi:hypothetical protein ACIA3K_29300 [Micromonospora sp. NPDC051543]|uniref:hypothetical protein n=1 Tax=Micromonospora sp. NPDC051543 TaxID=3364287 RepID=UPI0037BB33E7